MEDNCVFCKIARGEIKVEILEETDNFICFLDANPKISGHCLIIPKKHFINLVDLPSDLGSELLFMIKKVAESKLRQGFEGFNIVSNNFSVAGQVVNHLHVHFLPRKKGDSLKILE